MTIAFLTLFFGLITGPYPVELAVNGPVASVEMLIDGRSVGRLQRPPWKTEIDFGKDLLPHEVVARALDAEGREVGRAQEWANLPHPLEKVDILLENEPGGTPRAARVVWTNLRGEKPLSTKLIFDGLPVPLDASGRAPLPPHDFKSLHVLTAEVEFSALRLVRTDVAYGGEYGSEISTELTAVPVRVRRGKLAGPEKLGGWFNAGGQPVAVAAVEEGPAQLFVVRSPEAREIAGKLGTKGFGARTSRLMGLGKEHQVRFLFPFPLRFESSSGLTDLFEFSPPFIASQGGFPLLVEGVFRRSIPGVGGQGLLVPKRRIADAVAVAGLAATTENRRRAVLLVISGNETDESGYDPQTVRQFLAALRVSLFVWCLEKPAPGSAMAAWGECADVATARDLSNAVGRIRDELDSQRIVLVDGRHLPASIALSPAADGIELVGPSS
jgi:hypothetical protein